MSKRNPTSTNANMDPTMTCARIFNLQSKSLPTISLLSLFTIFTIIDISFTNGDQYYQESSNSNYTILIPYNSNITDFFNWTFAQSICQTTLQTNLASFHSDNDVASWLSVATAQSWQNRECWMGLFNNTDDEWQWIDGTSYDYTNWFPGTPDFPNTQKCGRIYSSAWIKGQWNDYYCSGRQRIANANSNDSFIVGVANCAVCNTPVLRRYTINIKINSLLSSIDDINSIWFRLKGGMIDTDNSTSVDAGSQPWTEWFERNGFDNNDNSVDNEIEYEWITNDLVNVGYPKGIRII